MRIASLTGVPGFDSSWRHYFSLLSNSLEVIYNWWEWLFLSTDLFIPAVSIIVPAGFVCLFPIFFSIDQLDASSHLKNICSRTFVLGLPRWWGALLWCAMKHCCTRTFVQGLPRSWGAMFDRFDDAPLSEDACPMFMLFKVVTLPFVCLTSTVCTAYMHLLQHPNNMI